MKEKAKDLRKKGYSYGEIAKILNIGKTTAHTYVNSIDNKENYIGFKPVPSSSEPNKNERSEHSRTIGINKIQENQSISIQNQNKLENPTKIVKEITGNELLKKKFDSLEFTGAFLELIGKPSRVFSGIIWGLPKGGKSNFSLRFADYLQEYFGKVIYVAAEEGESVTMQEKIKAINGSDITIVECRDKQQIFDYIKNKKCDFVFIDSINNAGIDNDFLELIKSENPKKSIVAIVQATKSGNFKGDQSLTHNCDFIIKVVEGIAYHSGRFNTTSQIEIFKTQLYEKNSSKIIENESLKIELDLISNPQIENSFELSEDEITENFTKIFNQSLPNSIPNSKPTRAVNSPVTNKKLPIIKSNPKDSEKAVRLLTYTALALVGIEIFNSAFKNQNKESQ
jgi:hypothetical protein